MEESEKETRVGWKIPSISRQYDCSEAVQLPVASAVNREGGRTRDRAWPRVAVCAQHEDWAVIWPEDRSGLCTAFRP